MSTRKIIKLETDDMGAPQYIQKTVDIHREIPFCYTIQDLDNAQGDFSPEEYDALYKQFMEMQLYNEADWHERLALAPIVDFYYDKNNCPVLIFPHFVPLLSEEEAAEIDIDDALSVLSKLAWSLGIDDEELGSFLDSLAELCEKYNLDENEVIFNLNNIGYNSLLGLRIIDYGAKTKKEP